MIRLDKQSSVWIDSIIARKSKVNKCFRSFRDISHHVWLEKIFLKNIDKIPKASDLSVPLNFMSCRGITFLITIANNLEISN